MAKVVTNGKSKNKRRAAEVVEIFLLSLGYSRNIKVKKWNF
jgi:hypothetical protein